MAAIKYIVLSVWFLFTLALAGWLYFFSFQQISRLNQLGASAQAEVLKYHRMLLWEGTVLFVSLIGGGLVIAYYILRDIRQSKKLQSFFLTFTHELKTPLASLQLQAECLREDLGTSSQAHLIERLVSDANRLSIQLENSLYLAEGDNRQLLFEDISVADVVESVRQYWPQLKVTVSNDCIVAADLRALESVLKNLIHNAVIHGRANKIDVNVSSVGKGTVRLRISDNGDGYDGETTALGDLFSRHYKGSGNGIGLFLSKTLIKRMGGSMEFVETKPHFVVAIELSGKLQERSREAA